MTLQQLQYILALDAERNFVRAAEKCFVTQPSLTMQVQKLEDELGVKIFDRSKKPLIPTPIGELLVEQARTVIKESSRMKEIILEDQGRLEGELNVGIIPTLAPYLLPLFVAEFETAYPHIKLVVREMQTNRIIEDLRKDELDLGILVSPLNEKGINEAVLFNEPMLGYVGRQHRLYHKKQIAMTDLDLDDTWLLSEGHCLRGQVLNICSARTDSHNHTFRFESGSLETLERLVEMHRGMTILPYLATLQLTQKQRELLREFKGTPPVREVCIATNRIHTKTAIIDALRMTIDNCLPVELKNLDGEVIPI